MPANQELPANHEFPARPEFARPTREPLAVAVWGGLMRSRAVFVKAQKASRVGRLS